MNFKDINAEYKKSVSRGYILYGSTYVIFSKRQKTIAMEITRGNGLGEGVITKAKHKLCVLKVVGVTPINTCVKIYRTVHQKKKAHLAPR